MTGVCEGRFRLNQWVLWWHVLPPMYFSWLMSSWAIFDPTCPCILLFRWRKQSGYIWIAVFRIFSCLCAASVQYRISSTETWRKSVTVLVWRSFCSSCTKSTSIWQSGCGTSVWTLCRFGSFYWICHSTIPLASNSTLLVHWVWLCWMGQQCRLLLFSMLLQGYRRKWWVGFISLLFCHWGTNSTTGCWMNGWRDVWWCVPVIVGSSNSRRRVWW